MPRKISTGYLPILLVFTILLFSCSTESDKSNGAKTATVEIDTLTAAKLNELKKIFFSLPSPIQMAELIEEKGYMFEADKLVPAENADKYTSEARQAIMLGIYGTDLGYASIFKEKPSVTAYFAASQKIARELHLDHILNATLIERFDKNRDSRDSTMNILTELYADMDDNLKEKQRYDIAAMVIAGGWIEALYLGSLYTADGTEVIRQRIAEQKYSLNNLLSYLDKFGDKKNIVELKTDLSRLKDAYNTVAENKGKTTIGKEKNGNMVIGTTTRIEMSEEALSSITTLAAELRNKYTNP